MRIGALGMNFQPYIYNTNTVSGSSLNKIAPIEEDALKSSVDYSSSRNQNPLRMGQTANFADVLAMQMQIGQNNAARVLKPADKPQETAEAGVQAQEVQNVADAETAGQQTAAVESTGESAASVLDQGFDQNGASAYMMSRAIDAYSMALAG